MENITIDEEKRLGGRTNSKVRLTIEEDTLIFQSWLNISKDAIVGVSQKLDSFWFRIKQAYDEHYDNFLEKGMISLKCHWQKINTTIQKFIKCYKQAIRRKKDGSSENDVINNALAIFSQDEGEAFKFEYAW